MGRQSAWAVCSKRGDSLQVIFNREFHLGKWYKKGDLAEIRYRLAVRLINNGVVHIPQKEKEIESKITERQELPPAKVSKKPNSRGTRKRREKVDRQDDSGTDNEDKPLS